jgi:DNA-directed RNA polymerase specialized sigma24 family protein
MLTDTLIMSSLPGSLREPREHDFEAFRSYLYLLARSHIGSRHQARIDPSDMVQQTLLDVPATSIRSAPSSTSCSRAARRSAANRPPKRCGRSNRSTPSPRGY